MSVTSEQVEALRAYLAGNPEEAERLHAHLAQGGGVAAYGALVYAAFVTAVRRKFSTWTVAQVVRYVANVRADLSKDGVDIDPRAAEILMRRALGESVDGDLDEEVRSRAQIFLLTSLVADEQLDDAGIDEFLAQARARAERMW